MYVAQPFNCKKIFLNTKSKQEERNRRDGVRIQTQNNIERINCEISQIEYRITEETEASARINEEIQRLLLESECLYLEEQRNRNAILIQEREAQLNLKKQLIWDL